MDLYSQFDADLRACRKCESILGQIPVDPSVSSQCVKPRPIVSGIRQKPILLIGQAPGISEYESGKPFQGRAGQKIREIFRSLGINDFDQMVYSSALVKCYAGRKYRKASNPASGCEDRVPTTEMVKNCRPFLERQLALVEPQIVVTLGSFPLKAYLKMAGFPAQKATLEAYVGTSHTWNGRSVVFFPHTSGGARWLNSSENKLLFSSGKSLLRNILVGRGIVRA